MNTESIASASLVESPRPLAMELAVAVETTQEGTFGLISTPTGGGYPPEDDPQ